MKEKRSNKKYSAECVFIASLLILGLVFSRPIYPQVKIYSVPILIIETNFSLSWTSYIAHLYDFYDQLNIRLDGSIESIAPNIWILVPTEGTDAQKLLIQNKINGENSPDAHIPISWKISMNNSEYVPLDVQEDGSLIIEFPSGHYDFSIKAEAPLSYHQIAGHYQITFLQTIYPQL